MRKSAVILFVLIILLASYPTPQQTKAGGDWSAWLFTPGENPGMLTSGQPLLVRVYEDGAAEEHAFSVPEGASLQFPRFAFTDNGNWIAYCVTVSDPFHIELHVVDLSASADPMAEVYNVTLPFVYELETAANCLYPSFNNHFDDTGDIKLALSVQNNIRGTETPDSVPPLWEILIFNLTTGEIEQRLTSDSSAVAETMIFPRPEVSPPPMPEILHFDGDVVFRMMPQGGIYGLPETSAYVWDTGDGTITPYPQYDSLYSDTIQIIDAAGQLLETEVVRADVDGTFPITDEVDATGTFTPYNVIVYSNDSGGQYPIFTWPGGMNDVTFISNGRHIAIHAPSYGMIALARNGEQTGLPVNPNAGRLVGAPGGYAFVDMDISMMTTRLMYHYFTPEEQRTVEAKILWENTEDQGWTIVWSEPMPVVADLAPFPEVTP